MSFLADEDDQLATLELALAFIDANCGVEDGLPSITAAAGTYSSTDSSSSGDEFWTEREDPASLRVVIRKAPSAPLRPPLLPQPAGASPPATAAVTPTSSSESESGTTRGVACARAKAVAGGTSRATSLKKHRDRKKAEMQSLRDQVAELEAQLAQLRLQRPRLTGGAGSGSTEPSIAALPFLLDVRSQLRQAAATGTSWVDIALAQADKRFRSEALNTKLRDAVQRQLQVSDALRGVLGTGESQSEELRILLGLQQQNQAMRVPGVAPETTLLQQLHANMQQMYQVTESVIGEQSEADWSGAASSTTREKSVAAQAVDSMVGKCIEIRSTSQLFCTFEEVGRVMWRRSVEMSSSSTDPEKYMTEKRLVTGSSFMKTYRIPLETPNLAHPIDLHGTSYMHKFDEETRYVCLWTSVIALPEIGAKFLEQGWMVAAPSLKPSLFGNSVEPASTILKMCYQISCASEGSMASSPQSRALADLVLKTLSRKTREHLQKMQNTLLDEYSPFQRLVRTS